MKTLYPRTLARCILLSIIFYGCQAPVPVNRPDPHVNELIGKAMLMNDSLGPRIGLRFLDSALAGLPLSAEDKYNVYIARYNTYLESLHNSRRALIYADSLLWLTGQNASLRDSAWQFRAYMLKANAAYAAEQYDVAFECYGIAKELALKSGAPCQEFVYLYRIAMACFHEENFLESARMFELSFDKSRHCTGNNIDFHFRQQEILSDAGVAYGKAGKPDSGIFFCRSALRFIEDRAPLYPDKKDNWQEAVSVVFGNLGDMYRKLGMADSAEHYFIESIRVSEQINRNTMDRLFTMLKLADLYIDEGRRAEAYELLEDFDTLDKLKRGRRSEQDNIELDFRSTEVYSKYYYQSGEYKSAIANIKKHDSIREEKWKRTNKILKNNLENGIDNIRNERQIVALEKDVQISRQQSIILFLTSILAVGVVFVIYNYLKRHRKKYEKLEIRSEQMAKDGAIKEAQLQKKIREDELNFKALIENTDDFLWSVDKDYNLLAFNRAYKEYFFSLFGVCPETGKPEVVKEFSPKDYAKLVEGYNAIFSGEQYEIVDKGLPFKGYVPDIEVRFRPIKDELGAIMGVSCFRRDITESVRLIRVLEKNNIQLRDIAWVQSHKLRGPLSTIMSATDYLAEVGMEDEHKAELLKSLREKLDEMDDIIHEIVNLTQ